MDARALLGAVADAYSKLETLTVQVVTISESGDEGGVHRTEQRLQTYYAAPDRVRIQPAGTRGLTIVSDGTETHTYFGAANRYSKMAAPPHDRLPGEFQPEFPIGGGAIFLFHRIAERVAAAELVRQDGPMHVLSVVYEPSPHPAVSCSPVLLWVDSRTHLIARMEGAVMHRMPAHDELQANKIALELTGAVVNEPIPAETFTYAPPPGAIELPGGRGSFGGGGGGASGKGPPGPFECWTSHDWDNETLIQRSKLRLHGVDLTFERRLKLAPEAKALHVTETITGPQGTTVREFAIPLV